MAPKKAAKASAKKAIEPKTPTTPKKPADPDVNEPVTPMSIRSISHPSLRGFVGPASKPASRPKFAPNVTAGVALLSAKNPLTEERHVDVGGQLVSRLLSKNRTQVSSPKAAAKRAVQKVDQAALDRLDKQRQSAIQKAQGGRKKGAGSSKDLTDLAWAADSDKWSSYRPIALPFVQRELEETKRTSRPSAVHVDEANRNAAKMLFERSAFDEHDFDMSTDGWLLVQLPRSLPQLDIAKIKAREHERQVRLNAQLGKPIPQEPAPDTAPTDYQASTLSGLPAGKLGRLRIRQSGKVELVLGEEADSLCLDVNMGCECNFFQQAGCLIEANQEFVFLGSLGKRMVATIDVESLTN
ncbi:MAG: uncharacterized protein KVP18_001120 [Porospora cf. gigantea A]|uniref:uncharacterized protein n=1 Tax=Porospora cf. gigantea A TaxID=2853593 RepID=UPI003559E354|nr:MAG: hypothetical protein KVP18_001120 [Porospora cf. gigantea A]